VDVSAYRVTTIRDAASWPLLAFDIEGARWPPGRGVPDQADARDL
jgi:hypothetical protein